MILKASYWTSWPVARVDSLLSTLHSLLFTLFSLLFTLYSLLTSGVNCPVVRRKWGNSLQLALKWQRGLWGHLVWTVFTPSSLLETQGDTVNCTKRNVNLASLAEELYFTSPNGYDHLLLALSQNAPFARRPPLCGLWTFSTLQLSNFSRHFFQTHLQFFLAHFFFFTFHSYPPPLASPPASSLLIVIQVPLKCRITHLLLPLVWINGSPYYGIALGSNKATAISEVTSCTVTVPVHQISLAEASKSKLAKMTGHQCQQQQPQPQPQPL